MCTALCCSSPTRSKANPLKANLLPRSVGDYHYRQTRRYIFRARLLLRSRRKSAQPEPREMQISLVPPLCLNVGPSKCSFKERATPIQGRLISPARIHHVIHCSDTRGVAREQTLIKKETSGTIYPLSVTRILRPKATQFIPGFQGPVGYRYTSMTHTSLIFVDTR